MTYEDSLPENQPGRTHPLADANRRLVICVVAAASSMIYLEVLLFHSLLFVAPYIEATMAIPIALLGISIGGLLVYFNPGWLRRLFQDITGESLLLFAFGFPVTYLSIVLFSSLSFRIPFLMIVPFALGSIILSLAFVRARSSRVYFFDLFGAGTGAVAAALVLDAAGAETAFFIGALFNGVVGGALLWVEGKLEVRQLVAVAVILLLSTTAVTYNGLTDGLNFARVCLDHEWPKNNSRPYQFLERHGTPRKGEVSELFFTHSSISGRTDCIVTKKRDTGRVVRSRVYHDGLMSDTFKFLPTERYSLDPRVPWGFVEDPDSLLIGPSAPGVVNAVGGMGDGEFVAVEIAKGKVALMQTEEAKEWSHDAYQSIDHLEILDGRTYLNLNPDKRFDHIGMMNAHLGHRWGRASAPEYLHTTEAIHSYLDHLTDRGFVNMEEVAKYNNVNAHTNIKLASTIVTALKERGIKRPGDHLYIYRWAGYIQYLLKRKPFTESELAWLDDWLDRQIRNRRGDPFIVTPSLAWHPTRSIRGRMANLIRGDWDGSDDIKNYAAATDDRPYAFDVLKSRPIETGTVLIVLVIAVFIVLLPAGFGLFRKERLPPVVGLAMLVYFGALGVAYLLVEMVLIQKYQLYIGSPAGSVVAVLGGMLVFSGLGSLASERFGNSRIAVVTPYVAVVLLAALMAVGLPWFFKAAAIPSLVGRMILSILSFAPLAFFMGMPFPMALRTSKIVSDRSVAALLFAVNGGSSAVAAPIALLLSMRYGYETTFIIGAFIYLLLLLSLQPFFRPGAKEAIS